MSTTTRDNLINKYCQKKREHDNLETRIREGRFWMIPGRFKRNDMRKEEKKQEGFIKAVQNVGQMTGEVLKEDDEKDRCMFVLSVASLAWSNF
jgi:hypothetical protein